MGRGSAWAGEIRRLVAEIHVLWYSESRKKDLTRDFIMKRSLAALLAAVALAAAPNAALAQAGGVQCNDFLKLRSDAEQKAGAIRAATEKKAERKDVCALVQRFTSAEAAVVKFLETNKTWCGVPEPVIKQAKSNHEKTLKFRTAVCTEAPAAKPRPPSLSDAIGTPTVDSAENTKTGRGTFDTLNGNPLAK